MRLRSRLLVLIAVLVGAVLLLSLVIIYRDVRRQILEQQSRSLSVSLATFRSQEKERFQRLDLLARVLEAEPGFRTILRRTDFATLQDHVTSVVLPEYGLDLLVLTDPSGTLKLESDQATPPGPERPVPDLGAALEGEVVSGYWLREGKLYQVVTTPLYDAGDSIGGTATLGLRLDRTLVEKLAQETSCLVQLETGAGLVGSTFPQPISLPVGVEQALQQVGRDEYDLRQARLGQVGSLVLGQNTRSHLAFLEATRSKLYLLGLVAVLVALGLSYPLLGRITNPVERMEMAQAELRAVVESNLDGLLALDKEEVVRLANPAAAVALGRSVEELVGHPLGEVWPASARVEERGRRVERSLLEREGRVWEVARTQVRAGGGEVGSLVVLRDATRERHLEERLGELYERLSRLLDPTLLAARNLATLALLSRGQVVLDPVRFSFQEWPEAELEEPPEVELDPARMRLVLDNLLANAMEPVRLTVSRDGGAARIEVTSGGPPLPSDLHRAILHGPLPRPCVPGRPVGLGIGLYVAQELLKLHQAHLEVDGTTVRFRLPAC
ncbi:MAG: hypothetical protein AMXMBFR33_68010 [Candidatus Xenobia bacterium]